MARIKHVRSYSPTSDFIARCKRCERPVRWTDETIDEQRKTATVECAECGDTIKGQRVYGYVANRGCDYSCLAATGPWCSCSCGGANHGINFIPTVSGEALAEHLGLHRERTAKRVEAAKKGAATRAANKAKKLAEAGKLLNAWQAEHADLMQWMTTKGTGWVVTQTLRAMDKHLTIPSDEIVAELHQEKAADEQRVHTVTAWVEANDDLVTWLGRQDGDFFRDMHSRLTVDRFLLTTRQEEVVRRIWGEHLAVKDVPALTEGRQVVAGTVEEIEVGEQSRGPYSRPAPVQQMQIRTPEGQLVKITVSTPMYDVVEANWDTLEEKLVGKQVEVKATIKASRQGWRGWGSRPAGFALA
jgi:hypothetical protein